jgi:hypothetical protein
LRTGHSKGLYHARFVSILLAASALVPVAAHAANRLPNRPTRPLPPPPKLMPSWWWAAASAPGANAVGQGSGRAGPATSPLKAIENLPSVNFQSADPFGAYEWATRVSIRGFNQNQLGFTLDGVPLGDATYGNLNGLHISRAIITDNIGSTA